MKYQDSGYSSTLRSTAKGAVTGLALLVASCNDFGSNINITDAERRCHLYPEAVSLLRKMDANKDGTVNYAEIAAHLKKDGIDLPNVPSQMTSETRQQIKASSQYGVFYQLVSSRCHLTPEPGGDLGADVDQSPSPAPSPSPGPDSEGPGPAPNP